MQIKRIKDAVQTYLTDNGCWFYRPKDLDFVVCCNGHFIGIVIAEDQKLSENQREALAAVQKAGGYGIYLNENFPRFDRFQRMIGYLNSPMMQYAADQIYEKLKGES